MSQRKKKVFASTFFNTAHLLPEDLRFEHGGAKLVSCLGRHLTAPGQDGSALVSRCTQRWGELVFVWLFVQILRAKWNASSFRRNDEKRLVLRAKHSGFRKHEPVAR